MIIDQSARIQEAALADLSVLADMYCKGMNQEGGSWTLERVLARLNKQFQTPSALVLIAWRNDKPVGYLAGSMDFYDVSTLFDLEEIYVDPQSRKDGIGSKLMDQMKRYLFGRPERSAAFI